MKGIKNTTAIIISLIMLFICSAVAFAGETTEYTENCIIYLLNDEYKTAAVDATTDDIAGEVIIPSTITYYGNEYKVTRIESGAFENRTEITTIRVRDGLLNIEGYAFAGCTGLRDLYLPDTLVHCYDTAFNGCKDLTVHAYKSGSNLSALSLTTNVTFDFLDGKFNFKAFFAALWQSIVNFFGRLGDMFR